MANEILIDHFLGPVGLALTDPGYMPEVGGPYVDNNPGSGGPSTVVLDGTGGCQGWTPGFYYSSCRSSLPAPPMACTIDYDLYVASPLSGGDVMICLDPDHFFYLELDMEGGQGGAHWGCTEVIGDRHNPANWIDRMPYGHPRHYDRMAVQGTSCHVHWTISADGHHVDIDVDNGGWTVSTDITLGPGWFPGPIGPEPGIAGAQVHIRNLIAASVTPPLKVHVTQAQFDNSIYELGILRAHYTSAAAEIQKVINMMEVGADSVITDELDALTAEGVSLDSLLAKFVALEGKAT